MSTDNSDLNDDTPTEDEIKWDNIERFERADAEASLPPVPEHTNRHSWRNQNEKWLEPRFNNEPTLTCALERNGQGVARFGINNSLNKLPSPVLEWDGEPFKLLPVDSATLGIYSSAASRMRFRSVLVYDRVRRGIEQLHDLKCWPVAFDGVRSRLKTFEIRLNDRDYHAGDVLILREYIPEENRYTGNVEYRRVTYVLSNCGEWLAPGYVAMSIVPV